MCPYEMSSVSKLYSLLIEIKNCFLLLVFWKVKVNIWWLCLCEICSVPSKSYFGKMINISNVSGVIFYHSKSQIESGVPANAIDSVDFGLFWRGW